MRFIYIVLIYLTISALIISCSSTEKTTQNTLVPQSSFDKSTYINPEVYGYTTFGSKNDSTQVDSSFIPINFDRKRSMQKLDYPAEARKKGIQGKAVLRVYVDSTGALRYMEELTSSHPLLTQATAAAAQVTEFQPATLDGKPVNSYLSFPGLFKIW